MQFISIVSHTQQENLQFYLLLTPQQESLETIVIFQYPEGSLYLERAIRPVLNSLLALYVLIRLLTLLQNAFGHVQTLVHLCFGAFFFVGEASTVLTFVYRHLRLIPTFAALLFQVDHSQFLPGMTDIGIRLLVVIHVFPFADILFKTPLFSMFHRFEV